MSLLDPPTGLGAAVVGGVVATGFGAAVVGGAAGAAGTAWALVAVGAVVVGAAAVVAVVAGAAVVLGADDDSVVEDAGAEVVEVDDDDQASSSMALPFGAPAASKLTRTGSALVGDATPTVPVSPVVRPEMAITPATTSGTTSTTSIVMRRASGRDGRSSPGRSMTVGVARSPERSRRDKGVSYS